MHPQLWGAADRTFPGLTWVSGWIPFLYGLRDAGQIIATWMHLRSVQDEDDVGNAVDGIGPHVVESAWRGDVVPQAQSDITGLHKID